MADKRKKRARAFSIAAASDAENQSMSPSRLIEPFYYDYVSQALSVAKRDILNEAVGKVDAIWARQALEERIAYSLRCLTAQNIMPWKAIFVFRRAFIKKSWVFTGKKGLPLSIGLKPGPTAR